MNIGIDIDDTICNSWETVINYMCADFNLNKDDVIKSKKIYSQITNLNKNEYIKYAKERFPEILKKAKLKQNVKQVIDILKKENKIIFITARTDECYTDAYKYTKQYLDDNKIYYDKIIVGKNEKGKICKLEKIDLFIDDSITNCKDVSKYNIKTILYENYYNNECEDFIKVSDWEQILKIIKGEK